MTTSASREVISNIPNPYPSEVTIRAIDKAVIGLEQKVQSKFDAIDKATESFHADLTRVPTLLDRSILGLRELLEQRLNGMENDLIRIHAQLNNQDTKVAEQITHLHELVMSRIDELASVTSEKFVGVGSQFSERDTRTDQRAGDTKLAVDAAFAAAKEATAKIEAGFTKQIDSMQGLLDTITKASTDKFETITKAADDKFADIKERLTTLENKPPPADQALAHVVTQLSSDVRTLRASESRVTGHSEGVNANFVFIFGLAGFLAAIIVVIGFFLAKH